MNEYAPHTRAESGQPSRLSELLECERELAALMAAARAEARRRIEEAEEGSARAEAELEASLEGSSDRVRRTVRERSQARVREIAARAREQVGRFDDVPAEEVERLAGLAFRMLVGAENPA